MNLQSKFTKIDPSWFSRHRSLSSKMNKISRELKLLAAIYPSRAAKLPDIDSHEFLECVKWYALVMEAWETSCIQDRDTPHYVVIKDPELSWISEFRFELNKWGKLAFRLPEEANYESIKPWEPTEMDLVVHDEIMDEIDWFEGMLKGGSI